MDNTTFRGCKECGRPASTISARYCGKCSGEIIDIEFPKCKCGKPTMFHRIHSFCEKCGSEVAREKETVENTESDKDVELVEDIKTVEKIGIVEYFKKLLAIKINIP